MKKVLTVVIFGGIVALAATSFVSSDVSYDVDQNDANISTPIVKKEVVSHIKTPEPLKGVYMTACIASMPKLREDMVKLIKDTELNSIVIDIKDYSGTVSFKTGNALVDSIGGTGSGCKVADMKEFIKELHDQDVYVIGRVTAFQDQIYTKMYPDSAVKKSNGVDIWRDRKGLAFVDVGARDFWDYILTIAESSYEAGFDEINFDYIRFPSDGDMKNISFTHSLNKTKKQALREFFEYVSAKLAGTGIVSSADIFGMTTTNKDDLGIGQVLEYALENFDYVSPMVYPSHYPPKFNGWPDPNKVPYEIVKFSMSEAVARTHALYLEVSTTTATHAPDLGLMKRINPLQLRPWLQDNDYPVHYTPEMVRAQIKATYDSGLTSWMLWDPSNTYTRAALLEE